MKLVFRAQRGRLCRIGGLVAALAAWGLAAASATAQLPDAPNVQSPVPLPGEVQKALEQQLPAPAHGGVPDSPANDVGDTVSDAVGAATAGGGATGPQPGASRSRPSGSSSPSAGQGAASGQSATGAASGGPATSDRRGDSAPRRRPAGSSRSRAGATGEPREARKTPDAGTPSTDEGSTVGRRIRNIVRVVPDSVKVLLAALIVLALALVARSGVERRRRHRLEREREQLLGDLGLLQRALLPEVPERLGALGTSVAYRPAEGLAAGGDFYDAFELRDGRVAIIVGDVSGHGRESLVRTASVRHALRTFMRSGLEPRAALAAAADLASDDMDGQFVTVIAAIHDPVTGSLTYASAGHPPPIICGPGAHEPITVAASPPLGIDLPAGQRQTTAPLPRGSVACFFTDGLLEARIGEELVGRERLAAIVAVLPPDEGAGGLLARMLEEADEASDDMAACVAWAVDGPAGPGPRVEELEVGSEEVELTLAAEFLEACGVSAAAEAEALDEVADLVALHGGAILLVTLDDGEPRVDVVTPRRELDVAELEA
jgi:serine phosphatase RsbU (regulator of sigma subunit)